MLHMPIKTGPYITRSLLQPKLVEYHPRHQYFLHHQFQQHHSIPSHSSEIHTRQSNIQMKYKDKQSMAPPMTRQSGIQKWRKTIHTPNCVQVETSKRIELKIQTMRKSPTRIEITYSVWRWMFLQGHTSLIRTGVRATIRITTPSRREFSRTQREFFWHVQRTIWSRRHRNPHTKYNIIRRKSAHCEANDHRNACHCQRVVETDWVTNACENDRHQSRHRVITQKYWSDLSFGCMEHISCIHSKRNHCSASAHNLWEIEQFSEMATNKV